MKELAETKIDEFKVFYDKLRRDYKWRFEDKSRKSGTCSFIKRKDSSQQISPELTPDVAFLYHNVKFKKLIFSDTSKIGLSAESKRFCPLFIIDNFFPPLSSL